ncbi:MAG: ABC transporter ATP-binding protein [Thermoleophilaceae bacterium]|nr:ABC transporter ATP-binding protein [Thermoleophilaceae bacterium]
MTSIIETTSLSKAFGKHVALDSLSIAVEPGEVFGFLGPNGAGKTTTIRILLGLLRPTAGGALVFGLDAWRDSVAIHRRVGNLPGDFAFNDSLTGSEIMRLFSRLREVDTTAAVARLAEQFHADLTRPLRELSRGNRQKIGLIQALAHDPDLLILDEPTSGLDPLMQEEFLKTIEQLRERGKTVFVSSHNLTEIERSCDRVALIRDGALIALEHISDLRHRFVHDVRIEFADAPLGEAFTKFPNTVLKRAQGNVVELEVGADDLDGVLRTATQATIVDLSCGQPSLEQAFVRLYQSGSEGAGDQ